ncbi:MAG: GNAT family N-acetyltransferase [Balneolaceae bacterium]
MEIAKLTRLDDLASEKLGEALSEAFYNEPNFKFIISEDEHRHKALSWFFGSFVARLGLTYGKIYVPEDFSGGAIWIKPNRKVGFGGAVQAGLLKMPIHFGIKGVKRSMKLSSYIDKIREEYAPEVHWYLMALGVDSTKQGKGTGSALLHPLLAKADKEGTDCYLETFSLRNIKFYEKFGFKVFSEFKIPNEDLKFWCMVRKPQQ